MIPVQDGPNGRIEQRPDGTFLAYNDRGVLVAGRESLAEAAAELAMHARALNFVRAAIAEGALHTPGGHWHSPA